MNAFSLRDVDVYFVSSKSEITFFLIRTSITKLTNLCFFFCNFETNVNANKLKVLHCKNRFVEQTRFKLHELISELHMAN